MKSTRSSPRRNPGSTPAARLFLALLVACGAQSLNAASQTWSTTAIDGNWATAGNWVAGAVPGGTAPASNNTSNTDIATFNSVSAFSTIAIDNTRFVRSFVFDTGAGAYTFTGGLLYLWNGGAITMNAGVTNAQVFSNTWQVRSASSTNASYSFVNNATLAAATLTFNSPTITLTSANGRPTTLVLDGTNTGDNTISASLTNATGVQGVNVITKNGTGTWVLSGANTFTGTGATAVANGIQINGGVLSARNNAALGTSATANANQVSINNTGTLEIVNGITVDNGISLNLNNGGTIRANGAATATNGRINLSTAAGTSATITTVDAADVFTVGNAANDLTGGAADTVLHVAGPGTVSLTQASNYVGTWSLDSGTTKLGNATALGTTAASVGFGAGSTATLQLNGNSATIGGLSSNATVGTPVIENGVAGTSTLTVNTATANTYGGTLRDGSAGVIALAKSGSGSLSLTHTNTYTGGTVISGGTLRANNTTGSATGTGAVTVNSGGTLGGSGIITGAVTVNSGGKIAAGNSVGTLTVGSLFLGSGSLLDFEFNTNPAHDLIAVTDLNGFSVSGGAISLLAEGTSTAWTTTGTYNLFSFNGTLGGVGTSALSIANQQAGYTYTFGTSGNFLTLTIGTSGVISAWNTNANGSWSTAGNWSNGVPASAGDSANFTSAITAPRTITLDGNKSVGGLTFNNATAGYTIAQGTSGSLTIDNGTAQSAPISVLAGSHTITAPVILNTDAAIDVAASSALAISGNISGARAITKTNSGSLDLTGTNTYSGGTSLNGGLLSFSAGSLGTGAIGINGGTLLYNAGNTEDISSRAVTIGNSGAVVNTNGNNVTFGSAVGNGGTGSLTKAGAGTLMMLGANTYSGGTIITGGTIAIGGDTALGTAPGAAANNLTFNAGTGNTATLSANNGFTLGATRGINLASGTAVIETNSNSVIINGALTGAGNLTKNGSGSLTFGSVANAATGALVINDGQITAANISYLPTGGITFNNFAALLLTQNAAQTFSNLTVNGTNSLTTTTAGNIVGYNTIVGGSGNLTVSAAYVGDFTGAWTGFSGTISLGGNGGYRFNGSAGSSLVTLDLGVRGVSVRSGTTAVINLGGLIGASGSTLTGSGGGATQAVNYSVGGANTSTTFNGAISNGAGAVSVTKVGTGTLTLNGTNTYTGATTISTGSLALGSSGTLASTSIVNNSTLDVSQVTGFAVIGGQTLSGAGNVIGATTINGTLNPGTGAGVISFVNDLILAGTTNLEINGAGRGTGFDGVNVAGTLTYGGILNLVLGTTAFNSGDTFHLFAGGNGIAAANVNSASFTAVSLGGLYTANMVNNAGTWTASNGGFDFTFVDATGIFSIVGSAVPEPSTYAIFAGFICLVCTVYYRRRRAAA